MAKRVKISGNSKTDAQTHQRRQDFESPAGTPQNFTLEQITEKLKAEGREEELREINNRVKNGLKDMIRAFEDRIQKTADDTLTSLGYEFKTEARRLAFWKKRTKRAVDEKGVIYILLDAEKPEQKVLCWYYPKKLQVGTIENQ